MKAIVRERYGSPDGLRLREIAKPTVENDRVLVSVRAASVNAADWHMLGRLPQVIALFLRAPTSRVCGLDLAGVVETVGKNVTRFKPGDEVFGAGLGAFAEYATAFERGLAPKPRRLTFDEAAAIPVAGVTALQGLRDKAHLEPGQTVLIYGAGGGVGTFAIQIAKALGAHVTAVTSTTNVALVRAIGADEVVDYTKEEFTRRGQRVDVFFDVGGNRSFADCRRMLTSHGTLVLAGASGDALTALTRLLAAPLVSRFGSQRVTPFLARVRHEDLVALKDLVDAGTVSPVIDRRYSLGDVPDALRYLGTRQARGKVVINVA